MTVRNINYAHDKDSNCGSTLNVNYVKRDPETLLPTEVVITVKGEALVAECILRAHAAFDEEEKRLRDG